MQWAAHHQIYLLALVILVTSHCYDVFVVPSLHPFRRNPLSGTDLAPNYTWEYDPSLRSVKM